jgi:hypothetical protein
MNNGSVTNDIVLASCGRVEELRDLIILLKQSLKSSKPTILVDKGKRLQSLQVAIINDDMELDKLIKTGVTFSSKEMAILDKKKEQQLEILNIINGLVTEVKNIKSILAGEMANLKKGRTALKGYGNHFTVAGRVIKKAM